jgi:hypothetical protein
MSLKRGWTPSPVRAARRLAQMNAARRAREAERIGFFWDLVESQGLELEDLTTRKRRELVSWAKWIQQCVDQKTAEVGGAVCTTEAAPDGTMVHNAPSTLDPRATPEGAQRAGEAPARAVAARRGVT